MINNKYFIRRKAVNTLILKFHPIIKSRAVRLQMVCVIYEL